MHPATIVSLKALIIVMIALLVSCQVFVVPGVAQQTAYGSPTVAYLQAPGIIVAVLFLLCVEVVLVCVWRLLSMVREGEIFGERAYTWVDVIFGSIVFATLLIALSFIVLALAGVATPSIMVLCSLGIVVGAGLALLILVLRWLLHNARQLQQDLAEVV
jgi:hypothetical protein